jgi:ATP-binding cassette, subfamily B, multidrug efflux pump
LPLVVVAAMISRVKARDAFRKQRTASSRLNAFLSEHISGVSTVQLFSREEASSAKFSVHNTELLDANLGEMHVFAVFRPLVDFFASLSVAVVLVAGAYFLSGQRVSIGVLIAFVHLVQMFYSPVQDIAEKFTLLQSAMAGAERVFDFLDTDDRIPDSPSRKLSQHVRGDIEFRDVRFSYKKGEEVLRGLTFSLKAGQMAAVVGPTGAGKSTIINLLTRMWDIESGSILLDDIPIQMLSLDQLRSAVLPVQQDVFLFSMSVADTIRMGKALTDEQVIEAAKSVRVHEFIQCLPEGYNTILTEGAANISTGQRQLISFARVVAHNPAVIVLDEASSSIDTETERLVQEGMDIILQGRSSIVIAHRLSTVMHADTILVLSDGKIAEQGTHAELMKLNKIYAELKKTQYAAQDALGFLD